MHRACCATYQPLGSLWFAVIGRIVQAINEIHSRDIHQKFSVNSKDHRKGETNYANSYQKSCSVASDL